MAYSDILVIQTNSKCFKQVMCMLSVRLPEDIEKRLSYLSKKTGRTKTYYIREAIVDHLDDLEDIYLSVQRLEQPAKRWTLEELEKDVDLES